MVAPANGRGSMPAGGTDVVQAPEDLPDGQSVEGDEGGRQAEDDREDAPPDRFLDRVAGDDERLAHSSVSSTTSR